MKQWLKKYLVKKGWYNALRYSFLFRCYQALFKPAAARAHQREVEFYKSFLETVPLIFDIGAYDGHKTAAFLSLAEKVVCCEPDEKNLEVLKARFRNKPGSVKIEPVAVSDIDGKLTYYVHHEGSAFNTISTQWKDLLESDKEQKWNETIEFSGTRTVKSVTLNTLVAKYGIPSFIKIDVEGAESRVLKGLKHPVKALSFESLWPLYQEQLRECLDLLTKLNTGYRFNIAVDEKLLLRQFVQGDEILFYLEKNNITHLEIVAKCNL